MLLSITFYIFAGLLTLAVVLRVIRRKGKIALTEWLSALAIVVSIITALNVPQQLAPADSSEWIVRKDYTSSGTIFEANSLDGYTSNPIDRDILISGPFRLYVQFLEGKGINNAILLFGRETESQNWWQDMTRFEVGLEEDGKRVFYIIRDGTSEIPFISGGFSKPKDGIVIVQFDSHGRHLSVLNSDGYVKWTTDLSQNRNFANGIFPEGIKLLQLSSGPYSEMKIRRLLLLEPVK